MFSALVLLACLPAGAVASQPTAMEWTVLDRFGGDTGGAAKVEDGDPLTPAALDAFAVRALPSAATCKQLRTAKWTVDGKPASPVLEPGEGCAAVVQLRGEGKHPVEVRAGGRTELASVKIEDELVVAIGDSVAAGEGNPQGKAMWLDRPCHRSAAAGFEVAARALAESDPHRSITYVSLACSGAEIGEGLLGGYGGVDPPNRRFKYPPQVERLQRIAAARPAAKGSPAVDAILLSVGANDVEFSSVVKKCATSPLNCSKSAEARVERNLEALDGSYDSLGEELKADAPATPVFATEYFDPTHDADGSFCGGGLFFTSAAESQWAYEHLLRPLNGKVETAAGRNGWTFVGGIAADFEGHGICAPKRDRWVRRLGESVRSQRDWLGTLHPNEEGHRQIARHVALAIAPALGFAPAEKKSEEDESGGWSKQDWIATGVAAVVPQAVLAASLVSWEWELTWEDGLAAWLAMPLLLALLWLALRALFMLRATWPGDPVGVRANPRFKNRGRRRPLTLRHLLLIALGTVALLAAMVVLAGLAGRAILWLRFWSSRLPADQAVSEVSSGELVSTGAAALAIFVGLGLAAAAIAWLLDGKGREVRTTRRGLVAIGLAEVVAVIWIGDFRATQAREIFLGLLVAALMIHFLVDQVLLWQRTLTPDPDGRSTARGVWLEVKTWISTLFDGWEGWGWRLWQMLPLLLLGFALYSSFHVDGGDRILEVLLPYLAAAILFAAPHGIAAPGVKWTEPDLGALRTPRIVLSLTGIALVAVILLRDERWLAAVAVTALVLGLLCLAVARASGERFAPYGLAVLVSVPLFAGAAAFIHGVDSPELQPVAVVLDNGKALCGAYVGESDGRLWMARVVLDERAGAHRPRRGAIAPLDADRIATRALGPLEPVDLIEPQALELRNGLLDEGGDVDPAKRTPRCGPPPLKTPVADDWQHRLAAKYQPELVLDREDGFWPVPVRTLFSIRDRRAAICRRVAPGDGGCLRLGTPGEFPWIGGEGEWLEYPAATDDRDAQHDQMVEALGTADPEKTAAEYFIVHGVPGHGKPVSIQYWFFYPFNYQPAGDHIALGGYHEGDFEAIGVLLSAAGEPRYVWMNRHDKEGRAFPWSDPALSVEGDHARVFAARGSHATYENCERQRRPLQFEGLIDDRPACADQRRLPLVPEVTPLIDLSRVGWGCWQGLFGHRKGKGAYERIPSLINDAPKSPLWQQKFGGGEEKPCRGLADPGGRDGIGEEVVEEGTGVPAKLRRRSSPLEQAIDECSDWEKAATSGIYMVACSQAALTRYVNSGLEASDPAQVRIESRPFDQGVRGPLAIPAVRRDRNRVYLDDWRIVARQPTVISVYATCPSKDAVVGAHFENVKIGPTSALTLRTGGPEGTWLLTRADGIPAGRAYPFRTKVKDGLLIDRLPKPDDELECER